MYHRVDTLGLVAHETPNTSDENRIEKLLVIDISVLSFLVFYKS